MKPDITTALVNEHQLILRMIALLAQNAKLTADGRFDNWQFYLDGVDFIRNFADRFHHAKEEEVLFAALVANGMPRENSPVAAMLMEHDQGRAFVKAMEDAVERTLAGESGLNRIISENALGYVNLLREHIEKEDDILYPLAERIIPDQMRDDILKSYAAAEAKSPVGFSQKYQGLVERYEADGK